jgi:exodeoxyribonuclease VII large subunit
MEMLGTSVEAPDARRVMTVSRLNRETRFLLTDHFGTLWVEGEISNLACPSSGHVYFTLKDADAQVRCAMFRLQARSLGFRPFNGGHVVVKAQVSLYEPRGDFQLIVEYMEEAGDGALLRAYEALKQRLAGEGLFDTAAKKPLPAFPRRIGIITSPTGAAIRDILTVLKRRFPALPVVIFPVKVQGAEAKTDIARAIAVADRLKLCDVLILARGGGSLEDLWAFNEEVVARAIHRCETPVVSAVGHEIDFTIADFVADLRAPTPSAAAEAVSPEQNELIARVGRLEAQLSQRLKAMLLQRARGLDWLARRLDQQHPRKRLETHAQRLDELEMRLRRGVRNRLGALEARLHTQTARLLQHHPQQCLSTLALHHRQLALRLKTAIARCLQQRRQEIAGLGQALHAIGPLATLARGYAIVLHAEERTIIRSYKEVSPGETVETRLARGVLLCRVEAAQDFPPDDPAVDSQSKLD